MHRASLDGFCGKKLGEICFSSHNLVTNTGLSCSRKTPAHKLRALPRIASIQRLLPSARVAPGAHIMRFVSYNAKGINVQGVVATNELESIRVSVLELRNPEPILQSLSMCAS